MAIEGKNIMKVYYMHVWKYQNETPYFVQLIHTNENKSKSGAGERLNYLIIIVWGFKYCSSCHLATAEK
jgi:hypothetical protein